MVLQDAVAAAVGLGKGKKDAEEREKGGGLGASGRAPLFFARRKRKSRNPAGRHPKKKKERSPKERKERSRLLLPHLPLAGLFT